MAKRPCAEPRCPNLTHRTRCEHHEHLHQQARNAARGDRYGKQYRRDRAALLADQPRCYWQYDCCTHIATTADHTPHGLVPACGPCNYRRGGIASGKARRA